MKKNKAYISIQIISSILIFCLNFIMVGGSIAGSAIDANKNTMTRMDTIIQFHEKLIKEWAKLPLVVESVREQNLKGINIEEIKKIDKDWVDGKNNAFAMELQSNKIGVFLHEKIKANAALYVEAFLCDNQGAVVGEYPTTSDYWQGDEDKFIKSFNNGVGKLYIGPVEFDESTQTNSVQISVPVIDDGKTIGVLIVGLRNIK